MQRYPAAVEVHMRAFYQTLPEKQRRRYAAVEACKLGHGGIAYVSRVLGCSEPTIQRGMAELEALPEDDAPGRERRTGGGRKPFDQTHLDIDRQFLEVLRDHTAGDPMDETVCWTDLTQQQIREHLDRQHGTKVSRDVVRALLRRHHYRKRQAEKTQTMKQVEGRNQQFENLARLRADYEARGLPVISIDTKKKELVGPFWRPGTTYARTAQRAYDHDFPSFAEGRVVPHSIYDVARGTAFINLGTSRDTSEFECDSLRVWWREQGRAAWPEAEEVLILCDGGGSHNSRHHIFKHDLQALSDELGLRLRIAHYPPYCSKYNPIEHRVFPHVTRACQGVLFQSVALVKQLMETTTTRTGLRVSVRILDKVYETGRKVASDFKQTMRIAFDVHLPCWNYVAIPAQV